MAERRHLRVSVLDPQTNKKHPVAEFRLVGDNLKAKWFNPHWKRSTSKDGIRMGSKTFFPWDKAEFLDALEMAYGDSSTTLVEQVT